MASSHPAPHLDQKPSFYTQAGSCRSRIKTLLQNLVRSLPAKIPFRILKFCYGTKELATSIFQSLNHMTSRNLVVGTPRIPLIKHICSSYMIGKMPRDRIPKLRSTFTTRPLQLIHSNICNPLPVTSRTGNRYILTFIDDYTRKTWLYFLATKSQTLDCFKQFRALVETSTTQKIETLHSNRGGEYTSHLFLEYCSKHGIHKQLTTGYSPHQNGIAKRKNRSLLEGICSIVTGTKIPKSLWGELAKTVNYIQNRLPTKALKLKTPEEMYSGRKPNFSHLRVIGCVTYCHIPNTKR
jgi:transposase InsO family protein